MGANEPGQPFARVTPGTPGVTTNLTPPRSALAIGAHPDDVEFGCGGTLAKWAEAGCVVHHLVCTDGSKGTWDPDADPQALAATRRDEQREAARRLAGVNSGEVRFLGHVDGELRSDVGVRAEVTRVIRELEPDVVLGHDPWKQYRIHPDHRHAGRLVCEGVAAARDPHSFPDQDLDAHRPTRLLLWEAQVPTHVEDVSSWVDRRLHALEAHASQFESTMHATSAEQLDAFRSAQRSRLADLGEPFGFAAAEVFAVIADL